MQLSSRPLSLSHPLRLELWRFVLASRLREVLLTPPQLSGTRSILPPLRPLPPLDILSALRLVPRDVLADLVAKGAETNPALRHALFNAALPLQREEQIRRATARQQYVLAPGAAARLAQLAAEGKRSDQVASGEELPGPRGEERPLVVVLEELVGEIALAAVATSRLRDGARALLELDTVHSGSLVEAITVALRVVETSTVPASTRDMLARRYENRFSPLVPWTEIWDGHFYQTWPDISRMEDPPDLPLRSPPLSPTARSSALVASLPPELLRQILRLGAQSLLPSINATTDDSPSNAPVSNGVPRAGQSSLPSVAPRGAGGTRFHHLLVKIRHLTIIGGAVRFTYTSTALHPLNPFFSPSPRSSLTSRLPPVNSSKPRFPTSPPASSSPRFRQTAPPATYSAFSREQPTLQRPSWRAPQDVVSLVLDLPSLRTLRVPSDKLWLGVRERLERGCAVRGIQLEAG